MANRRWLPSDYQDEIIPPPRDTPSAWVKEAGDAFGLAPGDDDDTDDPYILHDGDVVLFDWTETHGTAEFTIHEDGTWTTDVPEPPTPEGGCMLVAVEGEWETMAPGLEEFAAAYMGNATFGGYTPDAGTETIGFYSWSMKSVPFVFRGGTFHPVEG